MNQFASKFFSSRKNVALWCQKTLVLQGTISFHVPLCPQSLLLQCFPLTGTLFLKFSQDTLYFSSDCRNCSVKQVLRTQFTSQLFHRYIPEAQQPQVPHLENGANNSIHLNSEMQVTCTASSRRPGIQYRARHESYLYFIPMCLYLFPITYGKLHETEVTIS